MDNMVINSLLLWFVFRTIKQQAPKFKILLSATIGTVAALILPLLTFTGIAAFAIKLFVGAMMVFVVQNKGLARFTLFYMLFLGYTFMFGGAIYGILFMFESTSGALLFFSANSSIPVGFLLLAGLATAKFISMLIKFLNLRHSVNNYLRDVVIHYNGEKFKITSYLDTGNRLVDPKSRAPVIIITLSLFLKMFPEVSVDRVFLNKLEHADIRDGHYINFSTVDSKTGKMFVFAPQKIEIVDKNRTIKSCDNVRLGVSMKGFKDAIRYDALLNAAYA